MAKFARIGTGAALGAVLALVVALPGVAADVTADTVVATVNGTDITLGSMIALRETLPEQYRQLPDETLFPGLLEQLIQQTVLAETGEPKLTQAQKLTLENQRLGYIASTVLQGVVESSVTEDAIKAAYDARIKDMSAAPQTEYNASHILVADEQKAKDLKAQIDGGADFAELAKTNSTDGSAASGGELGWFGVGMMVKPFEDAVVAMKPGEVVGPIQTQFGWHLIKLNETRVAAAPTLDSLRQELSGQIQQQAIEAYVKGLVDAAKVTRTEGIDPKLISDQTLLGK